MIHTISCIWTIQTLRRSWKSWPFWNSPLGSQAAWGNKAQRAAAEHVHLGGWLKIKTLKKLKQFARGSSFRVMWVVCFLFFLLELYGFCTLQSFLRLYPWVRLLTGCSPGSRCWPLIAIKDHQSTRVSVSSHLPWFSIDFQSSSSSFLILLLLQPQGCRSPCWTLPRSTAASATPSRVAWSSAPGIRWNTCPGCVKSPKKPVQFTCIWDILGSFFGWVFIYIKHKQVAWIPTRTAGVKHTICCLLETIPSIPMPVGWPLLERMKAVSHEDHLEAVDS